MNILIEILKQLVIHKAVCLSSTPQTETFVNVFYSITHLKLKPQPLKSALQRSCVWNDGLEEMQFRELKDSHHDKLTNIVYL